MGCSTNPWRAALLAVLAVTCLWCTVCAQDRGWLITAGSKEEARDKTQVIVRGPGDEPSDTELAWWKDWKAYYNKTYSCPSDELAARKRFLLNMQDVQEVNYDMTKSWWASGNQWSDLDYDTFSQVVLMNPEELSFSLNRLSGRRMQEQAVQPARRRLLASSWDWRDQGKMTPVKNQGGCGSCWAFSATTSLEAVYLISQGLRAEDVPGLKLSTQQLIDCSRGEYHSNGCNGGSSDGAYNYARDNPLGLASDYPDEYKQGSCDTKPRQGRALQLGQGAQFGPRKSEQGIMDLVTQTPVTIYLAVGRSFQSYRGGVYSSRSCPSTVNHAVVLVGYSWGGASSNSHFILQNSWGTDWGMDGYAKIQMAGDGDGLCKMYSWVTYPPMKAFTKTLDGLSPKKSPPEPANPAKPRSPKAPGSPDEPSEPTTPSRRPPRPPHGPYRPRPVNAKQPAKAQKSPCADKS